ncbi:MAG: hypothetical protein M0007_11030 [Actinomycetota bacterium]|nr:hypothetical protein [Actinomycetota bacterium]
MPDPGVHVDGGSDPVRALLPPRHRLFGVFDDVGAATAAVEALRAGGLGSTDDIWVYAGDDGARDLDATGAGHGVWGRLVRAVEAAMANDDVSYLRTLRDELAQGHVVLAVRVANEHDADAMATELRSRAGHSFAYGAHWDFVPVLFGTPSAPAA